jgi:hypothetical protein
MKMRAATGQRSFKVSRMSWDRGVNHCCRRGILADQIHVSRGIRFTSNQADGMSPFGPNSGRVLNQSTTHSSLARSTASSVRLALPINYLSFERPITLSSRGSERIGPAQRS